ncbi:MFS general substrate transporter [Cytidiella melzeri]|nr:MFS general substrate transporter [Cytidiella melzeri]
MTSSDLEAVGAPPVSATFNDGKSDQQRTASFDSAVHKPRSGETDDVDVRSKEADDLDLATDAPPPVTFPDGGLQAWAVVFGAFCIQFCGFGYTSSYGVYQDYYVRVYLTNESSSTISWIGSINAFLCISGSLFSGQLFDRGYFKLPLYGGAFFLSFALFMLSLAEPDSFYQIFLSQGICGGIGAGLMYLPSIAVVSHHFHKRRTLAMSIVASGSSFGSIIHPIMLNNTLDKLGFGNAVRASAGVVTGMLLIGCMLLRPRLPPSNKHIALIPAAKKFVRDPPYVLGTVGLFFFTAGFYYVMYYLQLDAVVHNVGKSFAFYSLVILNFCQLIGRLLSGFAAQRFGVPIVITFAAGCCTAIVFGMIAVHDVVGIVLVSVLYGFLAGAYIAMNAPLYVVLSDDMSELGARMGIGFTMLGSPVSGALLTDKFIWWRAGVFSGVFSLVGTLFFAAACVLLHKRGKLFPKRA